MRTEERVVVVWNGSRALWPSVAISGVAYHYPSLGTARELEVEGGTG
jgi:hypothetical protein